MARLMETNRLVAVFQKQMMLFTQSGAKKQKKTLSKQQFCD